MPSACFGLNREEFTFITEGEGRGARPAPQAETAQSPGVTAHGGVGAGLVRMSMVLSPAAT